MDEQLLNRKLAAVMAADMVGYSARVELDEAGTLADQRRLLSDVFKPLIDRYRGRVVKLMGDGLLAEFVSVVDAVNCAISIQSELTESQEHDPILYRIGINLGDVVEEDGDLFGDGVNIAARLEQFAEPGGICISGTAYDHLKSNVAASYESLGEVKVKNISGPVRAYKVLAGGHHNTQAEAAPRTIPYKQPFIYLAGVIALVALLGGSFWWWTEQPDFKPVDPASMAFQLPDKPSIAVLPFANLSDDKDQEYFADGLADDMITDLSKLPGLFVIARNSSFAFKGQSTDVREVARQLGVRFVLEGSVRRLGDQIRINIQLIDAVSGGHLWAQRYDGDYAKLFDVQDNIRGKVVTALSNELGYDQAPDRPDTGTKNNEAYEEYLAGRELLRQFTPAAISASIQHLEKATELDAEFAKAHAVLAHAYFSLWRNRWGDKVGLSSLKVSRRVRSHLEAALDNPTPLAHQVSANVALSREQFDEAVTEAKKAIVLDSNDPAGHIALARALLKSKNVQGSEQAIEIALRLDPNHGPDELALLGEIQFNQNRYNDAENTFRKVLIRNPEDSRSLLFLASTYGHLGRQQKLEETIELFDETQIGNGKLAYHSDIVEDTVFANTPNTQLLADGLANSEPWRNLISGEPGNTNVNGATRISVLEAKSRFDNGAIMIGSQGETPYSELAIPGAVRADVSKMTKSSLSKIAKKGQEIIFFSRHYRSIGQAEAAAMAIHWGYTNIFMMDGGVWAWRDAGLPVEKR